MHKVNKPTIAVEVADAIESCREGTSNWPDGMDNASIVCYAVNLSNTTQTAESLRKIDLNTLMAALVNGYEREMTDEQRKHAIIKETFDRAREDGHQSNYNAGYAEGIYNTLNTLGIKIEGVNA